MFLYVYYKFLPKDYPGLSNRIIAMQAKLKEQFPILKSQHMKRPQVDEMGRETWMETYDLSTINVAEFNLTLKRLSEDSHLPQPRRDELFTRLS